MEEEQSATAAESARAHGEARQAVAVLKRNPYLQHRPCLLPSSLHRLHPHIAAEYPDDFCWSPSFDPDFVADCLSLGYLTITTPARGGNILLPKLHLQRCLMPLEDVHVSKSTYRKSKDFRVSVDACFDEVVAKCVAQHGRNWLCEEICAAFGELHRRLLPSGEVRPDTRRPAATLHSFEVWNADSLIAGELGYVVGACYTSLTGFAEMDSAGTVQCAVTPVILQQLGFTLWDLGMGMEYKRKLGAIDVPRADFLRQLDAARPRKVRLHCPRTGCRDVLAAHKAAKRAAVAAAGGGGVGQQGKGTKGKAGAAAEGAGEGEAGAAGEDLVP